MQTLTEGLARTERQLPSGRSVQLHIGEAGERLEVRSPEGEVEVVIELTDAGPVVRLRGARLELETPRAIALRCGEFEVEAERALRLSGSELRVNTTEDVHMNAAVIRLNC